MAQFGAFANREEVVHEEDAHLRGGELSREASQGAAKADKLSHHRWLTAFRLLAESSKVDASDEMLFECEEVPRGGCATGAPSWHSTWSHWRRA